MATGSTPRRDGFQAARPASPVIGINNKNVFTSWEIMAEEVETGKHVLVFDDVGHYEGIAVAEFLIEKGVAVTFATPHTSRGPQTVGALMRDPALRRLTDHESGFSLVPRAQLSAIQKDSVVITNLDSGKDHIHAADSVVLISGNESNRGLVDVLEEYAGEVFVTGDAVASRPMEKAIHDGHYAALRISDNQIVIPSTAILSQTSNPLSGE